MNTYLTFARLFQGTVKVEHLKGPVGIAHVGVAIADKGFVWLLFFMALISVNLAVINFLPMPIADGGHMLFLLYEQFTGRPPSVRFQNAAAICGLVILGTLFLVVTFHDVTNVFTDLKRFFGG
jgi:regulator of sigma E protease